MGTLGVTRDYIIDKTIESEMAASMHDFKPSQHNYCLK